MFVVFDALTNVNRKALIEFAATQRIPTMYEAGLFVQDGGLMSYGPSALDEFRRAAFYVDRILKGSKPAELPAEQPTRYYLSINMKAANALGLTVPPSLLLRADDVVQ
jgi:putative ABC transport system substrate-binding protein